MSHKVFDAPTMIAISAPWVDDNQDKPLLESLPLTAGLVPILVTAHTELARLRLHPSQNAAVMRDLTERAFQLDIAHDEKYRLLYSMLTCWASASEKKRREALEEALDTLFPDGLSGTKRSYLAESGNAALAASKITPEIEAVLKSVVVDNKNAFHLFNEWVAVGQELGKVERERSRLNEQADEDKVTAKDMHNARYRWIRAVNVLSAILDLESDIPDNVRVRILQPLRSTEAKFAKRKKRIDPTEGLDPTEETEPETGAPDAQKTRA